LAAADGVAIIRAAEGREAVALFVREDQVADPRRGVVAHVVR
jgi:hypothetical protein